MMRKVVIGTLLLLPAACAKPSHYEWGGYEDSLYKYYKDPTTAGSYMEELAKAAHQGDATGRTAPGIHAEYGYMLLTADRRADAITEFDAEKRLWPESTVLMNRMIGLANGKAPNGGTADQSATANKPTS
jgi:hypothetical protein